MNEWACYENGADVYASVGEDDPAWRRRQRDEFARMLNGSTVADLGCGPGYDLAAFAAMGLRTVGVDGSATMLQFAASNSPQSLLLHQDLRQPLGMSVNGLWSMFALLHLPEGDLSTCFRAWRQSLAPGDPLVLGLVESEVLPMREVAGWLNQPTPCVFHYHRAARVQDLLSSEGFQIVTAAYDTPDCYRGGVYHELKLAAYVIRAQVK